MKQLVILIAFLGFSNSLFAQKTNPNYDMNLATELGADDYGMKSYILVLLKTGSKVSRNIEFRDSCFAGHMDNIKRLVKLNKMIVAGPIGKNKNNYRGIFILNVSTKEEAEILLDTDPAVKEQFLEAEIYEWYGSAALPVYLEASDKVWKNGF